jgi:hypothetical protein
VKVTVLPFDAPRAAYAEQADALPQGWRAGDDDAVKLGAEHYPHFLRTDVPRA